MAKILSIAPDTAGLNAAEASAVFDAMERFASYGFNKSHAAAYAAIGFNTAYLKRHHPEAFFAASMNLAIADAQAIAVFAGQLKARGLPMLAPNVNLCDARFKPMRGRTRVGVAYGLAALRGMGIPAAQALVDERTANGRYTSFADLKTRVGAALGKRGLLALIQSGACDSICVSRADAAALAEEKTAAGGARQISMFDTDPELDTRTALPEWSMDEKLDREFDSLGFWLSAHPLDGFQRSFGAKPVSFVGALRGRDTTPRQALVAASVVDWDTKGTKSGGVMAILTLSDPFETFEAVAFDDAWFAIRDRIKKKATLTFQMAPTDDNGELRLMIQGVEACNVPVRKTA